MKRIKKWKLAVGVLAIVLVAGLCWDHYRRSVSDLPDEPIPMAPFQYNNLYLVENSRFGISSDGTNARATTDGINQAIQWAKKNGYEGVSLSSGVYAIACSWDDPYTLPSDGILVPSDTVLDLGKAVLRIESNDQPAYNLIYTLKGRNIVINGGVLEGDRDTHVYSGSSTHEWGCGVNIVASSEVTVQNMTIHGMTGDAITVRGGGGVNSSGFVVQNNKLYDCRRQGISVTGGVDGVLQDNTIYGIKGTDPQCGIDIEANSGYQATGLVIQRNNISNCGFASIQCYNGSDYLVRENTCVNGGILVGSRTKGLTVEDNVLKSSILRVLGTDTKVTVEDNQLDRSSKLEYK